MANEHKIHNGLIINETVAVDSILDEYNLISNSATALATQQSIKSYVDVGDTKLSVGAIDAQDGYDLGDGYIRIYETTVYLRHTTDHSGNIYEHVCPQVDLYLEDGYSGYIVAEYNGGSPRLVFEDNYNTITNSDRVAIWLCWRQGNTIHQLNGDNAGLALSNKLATAFVSTEAYRRAGSSGLILEETIIPNPRTITVTSSYIFAGFNGIVVSAFNSSIDSLTRATISNGIWSYDDYAVYDNDLYNPITGPEELPTDKYVCICFYRSIGDVKQVFYTLGIDHHGTQDSAAVEGEREDLPTLLRQHCVFIGYSVIRRDQTSGIVQSSFTTTNATREQLASISLITHGVVVQPTITKNLDGSITIDDIGVANFYKTEDAIGGLIQKNCLTGATLTLVDGVTNYIYINYNDGNPIYLSTLNSNQFFTDGTLVPIARINRHGTELHIIDYDKYGIALADKSFFKDIVTKGITRQSGLILSTEEGRISTVSSGVAWFGVTSYVLSQNVSDSYGSLYEYYLTAGVWSHNLVTEYDSSYYSDGTNRLSLNNNKWVSKYFFRGVELENIVYYVHGNQYNSSSESLAEVIPVIPSEISDTSIYIGKIVIQQGTTNGTSYARVWEGAIQTAATTNHNDLTNIQGGATDQNYHLDFTHYTISNQKATTSLDGYLSSTDWNTFNNKITDPMTTAGDIIYRNGSNITDRLALGVDGYVLSSNGTTVLWKSVPAAHDAVTLNASAITGGLSLNNQEISARAATSLVDGYLKHVDWNTFNSKEPALTKGNLTETVSDILTITDGTGAVIGTGTTIQVQKASLLQDGYLGKDDWNTFNSKEPAQIKGSISSITPSAITIANGTSSTVGPNVTISINKASAFQDGYLGNDDWNTFNSKITDPMTTAGDLIYRNGSNLTDRLALGIDGYVLASNGTTVFWKSVPSVHDAVTLNQSSLTGGLSLNGQEISFRAADTNVDGYLKSSDWNTFNSKEPALTKGNLTSNTISAITITDGTGSVIGTGTSITINKSSVSSDGYLGKDDWSTFNSKEPAQTKGSISEATSSVLTILNGTSSTVGPNVTIQVQKASLSQDGYLGKDDWNTFNSSIHNPVTLNASAITGGLSLNDQEISFRSATSTLDGYLKSSDWEKFNTSYLNWTSVDTFGLENMTDTSISFDADSYSFILTSAGDTWSYFRDGIKYTITGNKSVTLPGIPPVAGTYFIYIDSTDGELIANTIPWTLEDTKVPIAYIVWNNNSSPKYLIGEERHTANYPRRMHWEHHFADGAEYISGGVVSGYVVNEEEPSSDADNTFGISEVVFADESIKNTCQALVDPNGITLSYLTLFRTDATTYVWSFSDLPFNYTIDGYINYDNEGTLTEGQGNKFYNSYLLFTNFEGYGRFIIVPGRGEFNSLSEAEEENIGNFDFTMFPITECIVAYKFIWATENNYTVKGKCRLAIEPEGFMESVVGLKNKRFNSAVRVLNDLLDVNFNSVAVDDTIVYNGTEWVNRNITAISAGKGVEFYPDDSQIIGTGAENSYEVNNLLRYPGGGAEVIDTVTVNNNTVIAETYLYNTALGRTSIDAGIWEFDIYAGVSNSQNISELLLNIHRVVVETVTITITGTGTSRTATASGGTPFASGDASAIISDCGFIQTPKGLYPISAYTSPTEVTITTPTGYVNESSVSFSTWKKLFQATTGDINSISPDYSLFAVKSTQSSFVTTITDKISLIFFGKTTRTNNVIISFAHNGVTRYSFVRSPLGVLHGDLAGLQGGTGSGPTAEYFHFTNAKYTTLDGITTASQGDIIYSSNTNVWSKLSKSTTASSFIKNSGTSNNPVWSVVNTTDLSTAVNGLLKGNGTGVVVASSGTDFEPPVTKGNLTSNTTSAITITSGTGAVIGTGTSITINKSSASSDGYLGKDDWSTFNSKEPAQTKGSISETSSSVLTILNGTSSTVGPNVTVQVKKASALQDGYLGKDDFASFNSSIHSPVTLNQSSITGGLSLNGQEISFRAADTNVDGYLKSADWDTFNSKEPAVTKGNLTSNTTSAITITSGTGSVIGTGTSITINKSSASSDGYLGKDDWSTFNSKEPALAKGNLTETVSGILTITSGTGAVIGSGTTIQAKKASLLQDGYLGKDDFATFSAGGHDPVTLNASAITGGLSLNSQEISFRAADTNVDGYLKSSDWDTFNSKEPAVTKGNLTSNTTSAITVTDGTGVVIGTGTSITINKSSVSSDGYLGKDDWNTFNSKEPALTKGNLTETVSGILTITSGTGAVIGTGTTIQIQKASALQDGYLGKDDFATFSAGGHDPVTLNSSAITGGLSLNSQEISFRAATTSVDGYLKSADWNTFNGKASSALSNLGSVAINTTLLPGSNDGAGLGNGTYSFSDLYLATGGVVNWANGNATLTHSTGILTFNAVKLATGGETAPDVDAGGLCLNHGAGTDAILTFKSSDVAHPFTTFSQTDTYGEFRRHVSASGGLLIRGFTEATTGLEYRGYSVTASTGDYACIQMTSYYTDGGTGVTDFSNNSNIVGFRNNAVMKHVFKGGGDAAFVGALTLGARVGTGVTAGTIQWSGTNFEGYNGSAWVDLDAAGSIPTTITVANEASDTSCFPSFFTAATGDLGPKTNAGLTYNSSSSLLSSTLLAATNKITLGAASGTTGSVEFVGTTSGIVTVKSADAAGTWTLTLPTADGDSGQYLQTNGSGVTSWATVTSGGGVDTWVDVASFTRASDSTYTVTDNAGNQAIHKVGRPIRFRATAGTFRYAIITDYTSGTVTIAGAPLTTSDDDEMDYADMARVWRETFSINGRFADGSSTTLLASDLLAYYRWGHGKAYLVHYAALCRVTDTGANKDRININIAGSAVGTSNSNAGLNLAASATWYDTVIDINVSNYDISRGEAIEITTDAAGSNGDAVDLSVQLTFVIE